MARAASPSAGAQALSTRRNPTRSLRVPSASLLQPAATSAHDATTVATKSLTVHTGSPWGTRFASSDRDSAGWRLERLAARRLGGGDRRIDVHGAISRDLLARDVPVSSEATPKQILGLLEVTSAR